MKTRMQFICESCQTVYDDMADALECEKVHIAPVEIVSCEYYYHDKYAAVINVKFSDEEIKRYILK